MHIIKQAEASAETRTWVSKKLQMRRFSLYADPFNAFKVI
jgi:hypothetical protein